MELIVITTPLNVSEKTIKEAYSLSAKLGIPYIERAKNSLEQIKKQYNVNKFIIVGINKLTITNGCEEYFYHPSMAKVRIKDLISGKPDQMVYAMQLQPGDRVLDCTLGLGTDALVSSFVTGDKGKVVGLEKSHLIALITGHGLQSYEDNNSVLNEAMRRITVNNSDYIEYLRDMPDKSFDIVYFDPMFRRPNLKSNAINAFRDMADSSPLERVALIEAVRVACKRVVMKETRQSKEFERLGFPQLVGGKYSPVAYGVIKC